MKTGWVSAESRSRKAPGSARWVATLLGLVFVFLARVGLDGAGKTDSAIQRDFSAWTPDVVDCANFLPYSADPNHIWNRVHRLIVVRYDAEGKSWGCDEVEPLLWYESKHVLYGAAYAEAVRLLDEFTATHAEGLIHDPRRRAVFQHDLWAVFDWLTWRNDDHPEERAELEHRLAKIIKAVALTNLEIKGLSDNYAQLRGSTTKDGLPLPDSTGGWLLIGRDDGTPVAPVHSPSFPRSLFLVYLKLPQGGPEPTVYLKAMRDYSQRHPQTDDCIRHPCSPPQFPVGTTLALVRRALLIDSAGQPMVSPITESVQLRMYCKIPSSFTIDFKGAMQRVAEFQFTRRSLPHGSLGMRRVGESETQFAVFALQRGIDMFERSAVTEPPGKVLGRCHSCHQGIGAISFASYSRVQAERNLFILMRATTESQEASAATKYLLGRDSWMLLRRQMTVNDSAAE